MTARTIATYAKPEELAAIAECRRMQHHDCAYCKNANLCDVLTISEAFYSRKADAKAPENAEVVTRGADRRIPHALTQEGCKEVLQPVRVACRTCGSDRPERRNAVPCPDGKPGCCVMHYCRDAFHDRPRIERTIAIIDHYGDHPDMEAMADDLEAGCGR